MTYIEEIAKRTFAILLNTYSGDMLETLGAFAAIYPHRWKEYVTPAEMSIWHDDIKQKAKEYKKLI